jgi:long-subunit acyl-CoA synthetase (AMP-forming)
LSQEPIEKRVETSAVLAKMVIEKKRSFLGNIINIDVTAVSVHTPETKSQFKQLLDKANQALSRTRSKPAK